MSEKVSVIMPCYNHARYIGMAVDSILGQTHKNLEVLLIDNVSTDGTREIIQRYEKEDPRVKAIYHENNMGLGYSFTEGMQKATGDYISFTSSDDYWYPTKVEEQLKALSETPDADVCHTDAWIIDGEGKKTGKTIKDLFYLRAEDLSGDVFPAITRKNICCCSSILFRKKCLRTFSEFDPAFKIVHDWWFNIKIAQKHKFVYLPKTLVDYRIHSGNFSKRKKEVMEDYIELHKRLARMGVEPQRHHIAIATSAARIGYNKEARDAIKKAKKAGALKGIDKLIAFIIEHFNSSGAILDALNRPKHWLLGSIRR